MPFNDLTATFEPVSQSPFATVPAITEAYDGRTTAQLAANNAFTKVTVTTAATLVEAAKARNGMVLIVPSDGQAVTVDNSSMISVATGNGFVVPPGVSITLNPFNDPVYGFVPQGTGVIFFMDS